MRYPKTKEYESIYKRYFKRDVYELINKTEIKRYDAVLDLCGGNGRITNELVKLCDDVTYVDQEKRMIPKFNEVVKVLNMSVQDFINTDKKFDHVFCQQAINYWLKDINVKKFSNIFKKNGVFIFNTFNKKPSTIPTTKEYTIDNKNYLEISYLVGDLVNHVQIKEGHNPHVTSFIYISREEFIELLSPYFDIQEFVDGNTSIYKCIRK